MRRSGSTRAIAAGMALAFLAAGSPALAQDDALGARIVGGSDAKAGDWPYQVFIRIGQAACGGTLIAPDWVITAAHCAFDPRSGAKVPAAAYQVRAGSLYKSSGGEVIPVEQVIPHEDYNREFSFANDIALLKLSRSATGIAPVQLEGMAQGSSRAAAVDTASSPWARVIGWGYVNSDTRQTSEALQEAPLPIIENGRCNQSMGAEGTGPIDQRRVCAGPSEGGVDSCNGDSGGPLLVQDRDQRWMQVGIVSYGSVKCGTPGKYGVYTRVGAFAPWIERNLGLTGTAAPVQPAPVRPIALGTAVQAPGLIAAASKGDPRLRIAVLPGARMREGDVFRLQVTSTIDGYLALFDINERNEVTQLFPNPRSQVAHRDGAIRAGATLTMPDPGYGFQFRAAKPYGRGRLLAVVTRDQATLGTVVRAEDGLKTLADPQSTFARLEVVLKPQPAPAAPQPTAEAPPPANWAATLTDYLVEEPK